MAAKKNKVKFNIHNAHYAKRTVDESGNATYSTPVPIPGAVSITLDQQGELTSFFADGIKYYVSSSNNGYEGDSEFAQIPDQFREDILNEKKDKNGVLVENSGTEAVQFAYGFEIDGDVKGTKFWFYNCTATRPSVSGTTNEETKEPDTDTLSLSCAPDESGNVRAKTTEDTADTIIENWFKQVYVPDFEA